MGNFDKKEYMREYRQKNRERICENQKRYMQKHKDKYNEYKRKYYQENTDKLKEYHKNYYEENKEHHLAKCKEYRLNNKAKVCKLVNRRRKEVAEELKAKGQIWTYLPKTQRENKMVESLAKKLGCGEIIAREILEKHNWNYKKVVEKDEQ